MINIKLKIKHDYSIIILFLVLCWLGFHVITIQRSPLPWFDEVFFANMTKSFQTTGKLYLAMSTGQYEGQEIIHYGPIYFYTQAFVTKWLGFGLWQFRALNFLAGIGIFTIIILIARRLSLNSNLIYVLFFFLISDPAIFANMHSGRMDSLAMFLFLLGFYFYFTISKTSTNSILAAFFFSLSILTTPRIGFLFLALPVKLIYDYFFIQRSLSYLIRAHLAVYFIILISFLSWVLFKAGSITDYIQLFSQNSTFKKLYTFFHLPPFYQLPAFFYFCFLFLFFLAQFLYKKPVILENIAEKGLVLSVILIPLIYVVFIKGGYTVYLMPFLYLAIVYFVYLFRKCNISVKIHYFALSSILLLNIFIFLYKSVILFSNWDNRNPYHFTNYFMKKNISSENVLASHQFFYQIQKKNNFISNDDNRNIDIKKANSLKLSKAFIAKNKYIDDVAFFDSLGFRKVDSLILKKNKVYLLDDLISRFGLDVIQDYDCYYLIRK